MKRIALNLILVASLVGSPFLVGCDGDKVTEEKTTETTTEKKPTNTTVTDKEKTTKAPDGSEKKTTEHTVEKQ